MAHKYCKMQGIPRETVDYVRSRLPHQTRYDAAWANKVIRANYTEEGYQKNKTSVLLKDPEWEFDPNRDPEEVVAYQKKKNFPNMVIGAVRAYEEFSKGEKKGLPFEELSRMYDEVEAKYSARPYPEPRKKQVATTTREGGIEV